MQVRGSGSSHQLPKVELGYERSFCILVRISYVQYSSKNNWVSWVEILTGEFIFEKMILKLYRITINFSIIHRQMGQPGNVPCPSRIDSFGIQVFDCLEMCGEIQTQVGLNCKKYIEEQFWQLYGLFTVVSFIFSYLDSTLVGKLLDGGRTIHTTIHAHCSVPKFSLCLARRDKWKLLCLTKFTTHSVLVEACFINKTFASIVFHSSCN